MRALALLIAFLAVAAPTQAQWSIHITLKSYHFDRSEDYNELNLGVGIGYDVGPMTPQVGAYINSDSKLSVYGIATKTWPEDSAIGVGGSVGAVTGYDKWPVIPFIGGGAVLGRNPELRLAYIPYGDGLIASRLKASL